MARATVCVLCTQGMLCCCETLLGRWSVVMLWALNARLVEVFVEHLCRDILCEYVRWVVVCADFVD